MPVFTKSCAGCHKRKGGIAEAVEGGTFIEAKEDILKAIGTGIVPGKPAESGFLKVLDQTYPVGRDKVVMPPQPKAPKWSKEELDLFSRWISERGEGQLTDPRLRENPPRSESSPSLPLRLIKPLILNY